MSDSREVWNGAAGIVLEEGKLLMVKEKESSGWIIPSGGIENGESPEQKFGKRQDLKQKLKSFFILKTMMLPPTISFAK